MENNKEMMPWWERLDEIRFEDLHEMDMNIPDGLIMYKDKPYILLGIEKSPVYSQREVIDDVQFDVYECGFYMTIKVRQYGSDKCEELSINDWFSGRSCQEVFDDRKIRIPDEETRNKLKEFLDQGGDDQRTRGCIL